MGFLEAVLASLVAAAIAGCGGYVWGRRNAEKKFTQKQKAAVQRFGEELKKLIDASEPESEEVVVMARSIVSVRNNLRGRLESLASTLNSDIDLLAELLGDGKSPVENASAVRERLAVLKKAWPSKVTEMDVAVRKLLTELGLYPDS